MKKTTLALIALSCLMIPLASVAQESFGGQTQLYVVGAYKFIPRQVSPNWTAEQFHFFGNDVASSGSYGASVDLPAGASITRMECHFKDSSAAGDITATLIRSAVNLPGGTPQASVILVTVSSSGISGYQIASANLTAPETVHYRTASASYMYSIGVQTPADTATNASFRDCVLEWNLQVSPAPGTATFQDVPVSHVFFQYIEALAASGITTGCSASPPLYCPNDPLTRGQMAVFLARALGLHFPN